jgi:hypothetical protein
MVGSIKETQFTIPTHCEAGVVVNEGPDFHVEVQMVPVPEPTSRTSKWERVQESSLLWTHVHHVHFVGRTRGSIESLQLILG